MSNGTLTPVNNVKKRVEDGSNFCGLLKYLNFNKPCENSKVARIENIITKRIVQD